MSDCEHDWVRTAVSDRLGYCRKCDLDFDDYALGHITTLGAQVEELTAALEWAFRVRLLIYTDPNGDYCIETPEIYCCGDTPLEAINEGRAATGEAE